MSSIARLSGAVAYVERVASRLLIFGFVTLIAVNVSMRYLAGRPIMFAEELAAIMLAWLVFVSVSLSIHERTQISITLLTDLLTERPNAMLGRLVHVLVAAMLAALLWSSVGWMRSPAMEFEQVITTGWAKAPFFVIVPVFCATSLIHVLAHLFAGRTAEALI